MAAQAETSRMLGGNDDPAVTLSGKSAAAFGNTYSRGSTPDQLVQQEQQRVESMRNRSALFRFYRDHLIDALYVLSFEDLETLELARRQGRAHPVTVYTKERDMRLSIDLNDPTLRAQIEQAISEHISAIAASKVEEIVSRVVDAKLGRFTDAKLEQRINNALVNIVNDNVAVRNFFADKSKLQRALEVIVREVVLNGLKHT